MPIALTDNARAGRDAQNIRPVWLVEIDADQLGGTPTTLRWSSRDITLGSDAYDGDVLVEADPVAIRFGNLRARGGQAFPGTATVRASNTERLQATLAASYDLENDPCRLYLFFDGIAGADDGDKILLFSGVIDDYESTEDLLTLSIVDDAFRLIRSFPTERLTPATYPFAPLDDYGEPVPLVLGRMAQAGPYDGWRRPFLAWLRAAAWTSSPPSFCRPLISIPPAQSIKRIAPASASTSPAYRPPILTSRPATRSRWWGRRGSCAAHPCEPRPTTRSRLGSAWPTGATTPP